MVKRCEERMLRIKTLRAKETIYDLLPGLLRRDSQRRVRGTTHPTTVFVTP